MNIDVLANMDIDAEKARRNALVTALAETAAGYLTVLPTIPVSLKADGQYGMTKTLVTVHSGDAVTINCFSLTPAEALRVVQLLAEVLS